MDHETVEAIKGHFDVFAAGLRADIGVAIKGLVANTEVLGKIETRLDRIEASLDRIEVRLDRMTIKSFQ